MLRVCMNYPLEGYLAALFGTKTDEQNLDVVTTGDSVNLDRDSES